MLLKKIYLPIGLCLVLLLAIGFLALRSDVPTEPVKIYKTTTPAKGTQTAETETATSETTAGHFHADGTFHAEPHETAESRHTEANQPTTETIAFSGEIETANPQPPSERQLAEQRYDIAAAEYFIAFQEYHRKFQELLEESKLLYAESDALTKEAERAIRTGNKEKAFEIRDAMLEAIEKQRELRKRKESLEAEKPIRPTPPTGYGKE